MDKELILKDRLAREHCKAKRKRQLEIISKLQNDMEEDDMGLLDFKLLSNLLSEYIEQKISSYVEPQRAGTPWGEKIGFSARKYMVCLHVALLKIRLKELAKNKGLSYGVLRIWRTEADFKAETERHREEFAVFVSQRIKHD